MTAPSLIIAHSGDKLADILALAPAHGMIMEFGVAEGSSLRRIATLIPERTCYGFDSFEGLPEDWVASDGHVENPRGEFACEVPTNLPANVELVVGLFQHTLPKFLARHREPVAFVHIDCDLYSSAKTVLNALHNRLRDAIIVFDEYRGKPTYEQHEGRAWREFVAETGYEIEELDHLRLWDRGATFKIH